MAAGRAGRGGEHHFEAPLRRVGILRCVDVPAAVSAALGGGTHLAVVGEAEGVAFRTHLTPRGDGRHRLFVHSRVWKSRDLDDGDHVAVVLRPDPSPDELALPGDLVAAMPEGSPERAAFETQTTSIKRQVVRFLDAAKRPETRVKRIERVLGDFVRREKGRRERD